MSPGIFLVQAVTGKALGAGHPHYGCLTMTGPRDAPGWKAGDGSGTLHLGPPQPTQCLPILSEDMAEGPRVHRLWTVPCG